VSEGVGLTCWKGSQVHYISKKEESELLHQCFDKESLPKTISLRVGADFAIQRGFEAKGLYVLRKDHPALLLVNKIE